MMKRLEEITNACNELMSVGLEIIEVSSKFTPNASRMEGMIDVKYATLNYDSSKEKSWYYFNVEAEKLKGFKTLKDMMDYIEDNMEELR